MKQLLTILFSVITFICFCQEWEGVPILDFGDTINFEEPTIPYEIDTSATNIWQVGPPMKPILDSAFSPSLAMITDTINPYPTLNHSYFELVFSPEEFPDMEYQCAIGFNHRFNTDTLRDGGFITFSPDNGVSFYDIYEFDFEETFAYNLPPGEGSNTLNMYGFNDTLYNGEYGFSGNSNGWIHTMLGWTTGFLSTSDIDQFKGGSLQDTIRMRFNFISDSVDNQLDGWLIDDIYVFTISTIANVKNGLKPKFRMYPNPSSSLVYVETNNDYQRLEMEIRDLTGQELFYRGDGKGSRMELADVELETGVYLITLWGDGKYLGTARCVMNRY
ncbi:MAG: T9SS type A sorting domain-containing protein [Flavobacteriales bacterium]|nr:T9SS type A sorting domain-containing protein [Flavobacteriales bacterium]